MHLHITLTFVIQHFGLNWKVYKIIVSHDVKVSGPWLCTWNPLLTIQFLTLLRLIDLSQSEKSSCYFSHFATKSSYIFAISSIDMWKTFTNSRKCRAYWPWEKEQLWWILFILFLPTTILLVFYNKTFHKCWTKKKKRDMQQPFRVCFSKVASVKDQNTRMC